MDANKYYKVYSETLFEKFGEKVYKIPVKLNITCPNRDGYISTGGCIFCGEEGGSFENESEHMSVKEQIDRNIERIRKRYNAKKYIVFFQNFTNTYIPIEQFKKNIIESIRKDIVGISISTRPDCISTEYLDFLNEVRIKYKLEITIELGLQTVNYKTLKIINRGHTLAEFIDSMGVINKYNFNTCVHMILNLPWDDAEDIIEGSKVVSALKVSEVKLHSLYIVDKTKLGDMYKNKEIEMLDKEEYIKRVILFLEYLDPNISVQRIIGRAPKEGTLFVNWGTSWWKIRDEILMKMKEKRTYQGKKFTYLKGKALNAFERSNDEKGEDR